MQRVVSRDGTAIAYERSGSGPALILVGGATTDRSSNAALAAELAGRFTVVNDDRRGRGDSGDTLPYALEREFEDIAGARSSPMWTGCQAIAHTFAYDAACMGDNNPPARLARITQPTLLATGGASPDSFVGGGGDFFAAAADAIAARVPHAERRTVEGQTHMVDPTVLGPVLVEFFGR